MGCLLRYTAKVMPEDAEVAGGWMRTVNILQRRGFVILTRAVRPRGYHRVQLTDAGREAVAWASPKNLARVKGE
jgi:hypothetical protein